MFDHLRADTIARLLAASPANRRSWVRSILRHAKTEDAERIWNILRRNGYQPGPLVETPWLTSPASTIPTFGERASADIASRENFYAT